MRNKTITYLIIAILAAAILMNIDWHRSEEEKTTGTTVITGSANEGVEISITPTGFSDGVMSFSVSANTHSVDLSEIDMHKTTILANWEKEIKPLSAPKFSGHHSSGTLAFQTGEDLKDFKIIISGIPNMNNRVFEWKEK